MNLYSFYTKSYPPLLTCKYFLFYFMFLNIYGFKQVILKLNFEMLNFRVDNRISSLSQWDDLLLNIFKSIIVYIYLISIFF
jgi:hypothetical protein